MFWRNRPATRRLAQAWADLRVWPHHLREEGTYFSDQVRCSLTRATPETLPCISTTAFTVSMLCFNIVQHAPMINSMPIIEQRPFDATCVASAGIGSSPPDTA